MIRTALVHAGAVEFPAVALCRLIFTHHQMVLSQEILDALITTPLREANILEDLLKSGAIAILHFFFFIVGLAWTIPF